MTALEYLDMLIKMQKVAKEKNVTLAYVQIAELELLRMLMIGEKEENRDEE